MVGDRRICRRKLKGNVLSSCVIPVYVVALTTMALTEKHQKKAQVCKNNLTRRADKRRMDKLRVKVGVEASFKRKLVSSRLTRAGHVERMGDEQLAESRCLESGE